LLEWLLIDSKEQDSVGSKAISSLRLDVFYNVLAGAKINESRGTKLIQTHILLLTASINGDDTQTHGFGVLLGERAQTTASTDNGDGLAWPDAGLLQSLVYCDTGAENWRNGIEGDILWQPGNVSGLGDAVLLEGAVNSVTGQQGLSAKGLVYGDSLLDFISVKLMEGVFFF